jgi:hypothetical protein
MVNLTKSGVDSRQIGMKRMAAQPHMSLMSSNRGNNTPPDGGMRVHQKRVDQTRSLAKTTRAAPDGLEANFDHRKVVGGHHRDDTRHDEGGQILSPNGIMGHLE